MRSAVTSARRAPSPPRPTERRWSGSGASPASRTSAQPRTAGRTSSTSSATRTRSARPVAVSATLGATLDRRLVHIAYGSPHDSSAVHDEVIAVLAEEGPSSPRLERLRQPRRPGRAGAVRADLDLYGRVLTAATDAQAALHPALISDAPHELIDVARSCGAAGWKVNGAGGGGGSISIPLAKRPIATESPTRRGGSAAPRSHWHCRARAQGSSIPDHRAVCCPRG